MAKFYVQSGTVRTVITADDAKGSTLGRTSHDAASRSSL